MRRRERNVTKSWRKDCIRFHHEVVEIVHLPTQRDSFFLYSFSLFLYSLSLSLSLLSLSLSLLSLSLSLTETTTSTKTVGTLNEESNKKRGDFSFSLPLSLLSFSSLSISSSFQLDFPFQLSLPFSPQNK